MGSPGASQPLLRSFRRLSAMLGTAVAVMGVVVLIGWLLGLDLLKSSIPGASTMKPLAALAFVLAGGALAGLPAEGERRSRRMALRLLASLTGLIGVATIVEYGLGLDLRIDTWLFPEAVSAEPLVFPGRMAGATAMAFSLVGPSLLLLDAPRESRAREGLAFGVALLGLNGLIGYLLRGPSDPALVPPFSIMAVHAAVGFLMLGFGVLFARPDEGMMALLASDTGAGAMLRRVLPAFVVSLLALNWLEVSGVRAGLFYAVNGRAIRLAAAIAIIGAIIWRTARALHQSEQLRARVEAERELFATVVDSSFDAIGSASLAGVFTSWNRGAEKLFGYRSEEIIGRSTQTIVPPDRREELEGLMNRLRHGSSLERLETVRLKKDGTPVDVSMVASAVRDARGATTGIAVISRDISDRKAVERLRTDLVAMLSHDIKTPIGVILGFTEILGQELPDGASCRTALEAIERSAHSVLALAVNFIEMMRIDSGNLEVRKAPISLNELARNVTRNLASIARLQDVHLDLALDPVDPRPPIDTALIERVITNLLSNALKFSPKGGRVRLVTEARSDEVSLSVVDQGPGIPEEDRTKLFRRFASFDPEHFGSSGLGLFIVKTFVEAHAGRAGVDCPAAGGSVFTIWLPMQSRPHQGQEVAG